MKSEFRFLASVGVGLCLAFVILEVAKCNAEAGEAAIDVENLSRSSATDVAAARIKDKSTGVELEGTLEVTFSNGTTKLNPGALNNVHWEVNGDTVIGRLVGPAGQELAVLSGAIHDGEMSGDFRDAAGRNGTWKFTGDFSDPQ